MRPRRREVSRYALLIFVGPTARCESELDPETPIGLSRSERLLFSRLRSSLRVTDTW